MMIVLILLFMVVGVFVKTSGQPNLDYTCTTADADGQERNGVCVSIFNCPEITKLVYEFGDLAENYVRSSVCTNYINDIIVCCKEPRRFGINSINNTDKSIQSRHKSIDNTNVDLRNIFIFQTSTTVAPATGTSPDAAVVTEDPNTILTFSPINSEIESSVTAVESLSIAVTTTATEANKNNGLNKLKKSIEYCEQTFSNGVQHPYLIKIKPFDHDFSKYIQPCNGIIIENEYILTTSQCGYQAKSILLRQFNTSDDVNCSTNLECDEPTLELSVEEVFHSGKMEDGQSGVAVLKLSEALIYNDYVKPLCLPLNQTRTKKEFQGALSLFMMIKNSTATVCYNNDLRTEENVLEENTNALCISPDKYSPSWCVVDLGGPLIHINTDNKKLYLDGLISNFTSDERCTNTNVTGIFLTSNLIDFIAESII